jgi:hypothetical protein
MVAKLLPEFKTLKTKQPSIAGATLTLAPDGTANFGQQKYVSRHDSKKRILINGT